MDNEAICQSFGQEWHLLSVPHAEISVAVRGKSERGGSPPPQIQQLEILHLPAP
jgi:hypothetical protein